MFYDETLPEAAIVEIIYLSRATLPNFILWFKNQIIINQLTSILILEGMVTSPLLRPIEAAGVSDKQLCLLAGYEVPDASSFPGLWALLMSEPSAVPAAVSWRWKLHNCICCL